MRNTKGRPAAVGPKKKSRGYPRCRPMRKAGETEQGKARTRKLMKKPAIDSM